jgi:glutathione S-transferase
LTGSIYVLYSKKSHEATAEESIVNLFFSPLACSLATRISLYEAEADAEYTRVDTRAKRVADGSDFYEVNPMGQVPVLRTDDGMLLTENSAVLQYVAGRYPSARLAPPDGPDRSRLQQWLSFIGTELHKALFVPLLDPKAPEAVKAYARDKAPLRLGILQEHLAAHEFLLDGFTVADAYLVAVLNWAAVTQVDLSQWPAVRDYHERLLKRPSVSKAFAEEFAMYQAQQRSGTRT